VNASSATTRFASVVLDVDSTLTAVEGIEWLGARRSPEVSRQVSEMTHQAMTGVTPLQDVYAARLALVRPGRDEIAALADAYRQGTMPGAAAAIAGLRAAGVGICVISGGIREAVVPFAAALGVGQDEVHAVLVHFTPDGRYAGFDTESPLTRRGGKSTVVLRSGLSEPVLAVGDGSTDAELKTTKIAGRYAVGAFAAFVGVAARPSVIAVADYVISRFDELLPIVTGSPTR
jgi:phosphoserine phosphatase